MDLISFPLVEDPFWMKFTDFIGSKCLKQVAVWTTAEPQEKREVEGRLARRYDGVLPVTVRHGAKWEDVSALIEKKKGPGLPEG